MFCYKELCYRVKRVTLYLGIILCSYDESLNIQHTFHLYLIHLRLITDFKTHQGHYCEGNRSKLFPKYLSKYRDDNYCRKAYGHKL